MRIFAAILGTETNTFAPLPTGLAEFEPIEPTPGGPPDEMKHPFAQIIRAVRERARRDGHEVVCGRGAFATPGGLTTRRAYETLRDRLLDDLRAALPVDIVALGLHGAMIADGYDDAEGDFLAHVRRLVGPQTIVAAELDLHGHLTQQKVDSADILVFFKEYPHTDIYERAVEVVDLAVAAAEKRIKPVMSVFDPKMISVFHSSREPTRSFVDRMTALEGRDGVLSVSLVHGFPWGDCPEFGTKILVVTDNRKAYGDALAEQLGRDVIAMREKTLADYMTPDHAIDVASNTQGCVVVADSADNPGGGAAGDSTFVLARMIARGVADAALGPLWDPGAVAHCFAAGEGARLALRIGGKTSAASGDPLDVEALVLKCVRDAKMIDAFGRGEKATALMGDSAAIRVGGVDIVLNACRTQAMGDVFTPLGIDWRAKRLVVVKSSQHFYAAYAPSAVKVLYVQTPASMTMDWNSLPFRKRPDGVWPFER
ncbi:MAG: M81 family metallopeptidase [Hyphomicrobiales bacterium]|nr:M81 family metallopeptidase [Hyphomicrobiales bacterium]